MTNKPAIAVRAIIKNHTNEVLILKRDHTEYGQGKWNLPGGKVEYNETLVSALIAEVREETTLEVTRHSFFTYLDNLPEKPGLPHYVTMVFLCNAEGSVTLSDESSDFRWIGKDDLENFSIAFSNDEALKMFWETPVN